MEVDENNPEVVIGLDWGKRFNVILMPSAFANAAAVIIYHEFGVRLQCDRKNKKNMFYIFLIIASCLWCYWLTAGSPSENATILWPLGSRCQYHPDRHFWKCSKQIHGFNPSAKRTSIRIIIPSMTGRDTYFKPPENNHMLVIHPWSQCPRLWWQCCKPNAILTLGLVYY